MASPIKLPDLGTTTDEVYFVEWKVREGEVVRRGDIVAELETDKAVMDLECPVEGTVLRLIAEPDSTVRTGDVLAWVGEPGEAVPEGPEAGAAPGKPEAQVIARDESAAAREREAAPGPVPAVVGEGRVSPVVRNLAAKLGVDLAAVSGTGEGGAVTREDVRQAAEGKAKAGAEAVAAEPEPARPPEAEAAAAEIGRPAEGYDADFLLALYRKMVLIRQFEERVKFLFLEGIMPGTIHQYQGEEAIAVGVCAALREDDIITSTHRPHGHAIAKGLTVESLMHELFGKTTGCCHGKGGSMHIGDLEKGMVPAIAIVGGGVPVATGIALAFKMRKEPRVAVCFMGDGAVNEGAFHEAVNMGAIWDLPVVYVIENNRYSASTPICQTTRLERLSDRAAGYGLPGVTADGNDVLGVYETAGRAIERARAGGGPTLVELLTYRITGHSRRDPCNYQPEEERRQALEREPIRRFAARLVAEGVADEARLEAIRAEAEVEVEAAVESAMAAPDPAPEDALEGLWA